MEPPSTLESLINSKIQGFKDSKIQRFIASAVSANTVKQVRKGAHQKG
jgi:hypothetical protein